MDFEAKTLGDLVGIEQLTEIRRKARSARIDADEECLFQMKCKTQDLSRHGAQVFITHLETLQPKKATA